MKIGDKVKCEVVFEVKAINDEFVTISIDKSQAVFEERGLNNLELTLKQMQLLDGTKFQIIKEK